MPRIIAQEFDDAGLSVGDVEMASYVFPDEIHLHVVNSKTGDVISYAIPKAEWDRLIIGTN